MIWETLQVGDIVVIESGEYRSVLDGHTAKVIRLSVKKDSIDLKLLAYQDFNILTNFRGSIRKLTKLELALK